MVTLRRDVSGKEHRKMPSSAGIGECTLVEDASCSPESRALSNTHGDYAVTNFLNLSENKTKRRGFGTDKHVLHGYGDQFIPEDFACEEELDSLSRKMLKCQCVARCERLDLWRTVNTLARSIM